MRGFGHVPSDSAEGDGNCSRNRRVRDQFCSGRGCVCCNIHSCCPHYHELSGLEHGPVRGCLKRFMMFTWNRTCFEIMVVNGIVFLSRKPVGKKYV
jgi:hypothetical protein